MKRKILAVTCVVLVLLIAFVAISIYGTKHVEKDLLVTQAPKEITATPVPTPSASPTPGNTQQEAEPTSTPVPTPVVTPEPESPKPSASNPANIKTDVQKPAEQKPAAEKPKKQEETKPQQPVSTPASEPEKKTDEKPETPQKKPERPNVTLDDIAAILGKVEFMSDHTLLLYFGPEGRSDTNLREHFYIKKLDKGGFQIIVRKFTEEDLSMLKNAITPILPTSADKLISLITPPTDYTDIDKVYDGWNITISVTGGYTSIFIYP